MDFRSSWPLLKNGLLLATGDHLLLTVAARFAGPVARLYPVLAVVITALVALYYGVSTNPSSALGAATGGAVVGAVASVAGMVLAGVLGASRSGATAWSVAASAVTGALLSAVGSVVARRAFGA